MIEPMTKYSFVLLSGKAEDFLKRLEDLGVVDITRSVKPVDERSAQLLGRSEALRHAATVLSGIDYASDPDLEAIQAACAATPAAGDRLAAFQERESQLTTLKAGWEEAKKEAEDRKVWGSFDADTLRALEDRGLKVRFYRVATKSFDPGWAAQYPLQEIASDGKHTWFVTVSDDPDYRFPVDELPAPDGDFRQLEARTEELHRQLTDAKGALLALKADAPALLSESETTGRELQRYLADAGSGKAAEDLITTFEGFAPETEDARLQEAFDAMDGIVYLREKATKQDNPPIALKGNRFTRMFTVLTDMYGRPDYDEFDPTPYLSVFFLLFFAMCMGDAGYGLALILIGLFLRKSEGMKDLAPLVMTLGAGTFVIGTVMHTFFGYDISGASWVPDWLKKCMVTGNIAGFDANMVLSIVIGVIHLCLAFLLKGIYATKKNGFMNSLGTWGWTLLIVGGVIVGAVSLTGVLDSTVTKWIIIALGVVSAAGIFLLSDIHRNPFKNIGPGLWETYNTAPGLLGDVLSYLRLYALGLAGGMLGKAFNDIAAMTLGDGGFGFGWIACALIFVIGHTLNLAMCCLGAFVHPLRLNFLEFFKNSGYEGKGRMYRPITNKQNQ